MPSVFGKTYLIWNIYMKKFFATSLLVIFTISCAEQGGPITKQGLGTVLGGVGGAVIGSQFGKGSGNLAAVAVGTLAGAALGNSMGASLDRADQQYLVTNTQSTLEGAKLGTTSSWRNPDSGNHGTITPVRTFEAKSGAYCREYTQTITVGGKTQQGYGTACRQPDGAWKVIE